MTAVSPLSLGDSALAGAALLLSTYELWLYARRPTHREHLWMAVVSAMAAAYAVLMAVHYNVGSATALILTRFEGVALGAICFSCLAWVLTVTGKATRRVMALVLVAWAVLALVTLSPWVIHSMYAVTPRFGGAVFWRRVQTPAVGALTVIGLGIVFGALLLSTRAPAARRAEARDFQIGSGLWSLTALHAAVAGLLGRPPSFSTIEYGFTALALGVVASDARRYMQALAASERATETALSRHRALEALHQDVVASIGEGVVVLDSEQRVLLWNPVAAELTGVPQDDALGRRLGDLLKVTSADRKTLSAGLDQVAQGRTVTTVPLALGGGARDVQVVWTLAPFGADRSAHGAIAVLHDVTAEQATRAALVRSERNSRALIESLPDAIAVLSDERILYINTALSDLLGLGPEDSLSGLSAGRLVHQSDRERLREIRGGGATAALRLNSKKRAVTAEIRCMPIEFDGVPAQALMARDVTEQNELTARMMDLDRMVAVGTLAAGVGHEINNPLAYVVTNLEELRSTFQGARGGPESRLLIEESLHGARRIRDIVQALSSFSRAGVERGTVSLGDALRSATAMAGNTVRHRARISVDQQGDYCVVANEAELAQVFLNLLLNASQAIGSGETNEIRVRTYADVDAGRVVCEVTDTGTGIPPDILPRIFDPFFTTKPVGRGTGLGLSICRQTVRALGGDLEVESEVGVGSTFRVLLPISEPATEPLRLNRRVPPEAGARLRVMLVDDEESLLRALSRPLRRHFDLTLCVSAEEALERLESGEPLDAIVTDLMMPGTSGMELYDQISVRFPAMAERTLFTTGGAFTAEAKSFCLQMGDRVLPKPIAVAELRERVRAIASRNVEETKATAS